MTARLAERRARRGLATLVLLLLASVAVPAAAQGVRRCAGLVVIDSLASVAPGGNTGAAVDVDLALAPGSNTSVALADRSTRFLAHVALGPNRQVFMVDMEADPAGLGNDQNGGLGHGAVFIDDMAVAGAIALLADGTNCGPSITSCDPVSGVFVDPIGIAWSYPFGVLAMVDVDADPSGLGPDSLGRAGHGAVLAVNPTTGQLDLIADGSLYQGMIPNGRPSIFEDPVALTFGRDGSLYVVDQLAQPLLTGPGAVFRVDLPRGSVSLVAASPFFVALRDVAVEPSGNLLVLDRLAGGNGTVFRIDPTRPPPDNIIGQFSPGQLVDPQGIVATGSGRIYVADAAADPLGQGVSGAVFEVPLSFTAAMTASSTQQYEEPWGVDLTDAEALERAVPQAAFAGTATTVQLIGGVFSPDPIVDFGPGIFVNGVTTLNANTLLVDIAIDSAAPLGLHDVTVINPNTTHAFHCELFEVLASPGCPASTPVGGTLHVSKPGLDRVHLQWDGTGDPCLASFRVYRAYTAEPGARPGYFPDDPEFVNVTGDDDDASPWNTAFTHSATSGRNEYYLVVPMGTDGMEGPVGAYGR